MTVPLPPTIWVSIRLRCNTIQPTVRAMPEDNVSPVILGHTVRMGQPVLAFISLMNKASHVWWPRAGPTQCMPAVEIIVPARLEIGRLIAIVSIIHKLEPDPLSKLKVVRVRHVQYSRRLEHVFLPQLIVSPTKDPTTKLGAICQLNSATYQLKIVPPKPRRLVTKLLACNVTIVAVAIRTPPLIAVNVGLAKMSAGVLVVYRPPMPPLTILGVFLE